MRDCGGGDGVADGLDYGGGGDPGCCEGGGGGRGVVFGIFVGEGECWDGAVAGFEGDNLEFFRGHCEGSLVKGIELDFFSF